MDQVMAICWETSLENTTCFTTPQWVHSHVRVVKDAVDRCVKFSSFSQVQNPNSCRAFSENCIGYGVSSKVPSGMCS